MSTTTLDAVMMNDMIFMGKKWEQTRHAPAGANSDRGDHSVFHGYLFVSLALLLLNGCALRRK